MELKASFDTVEDTLGAVRKLQALRIMEIEPEPEGLLLTAFVEERVAERARTVITAAGGVLEDEEQTPAGDIWMV